MFNLTPNKIDKEFKIVPGDMVTLPAGRGWKRAKVLRLLGNGMIKIMYKDGTKEEVSVGDIMTPDEIKIFRKMGESTRIVRDGYYSKDNNSHGMVLSEGDNKEEENDVESHGSHNNGPRLAS